MKLICLFQLRILKEAIKAVIKGPYTVRFPYAPHIPEAGFRGAPEYHEDDCIGCGACAQVCPPGAITLSDEVSGDSGKRTLTVRYDLCIMCGQCEANCITKKGIIASKKFDLATFNRHEAVNTVEKELLLCEHCKTPIAAKEHISWLAEQLGPLSFTNPSLFMSSLRKASLASEACPRHDAKEESLPPRRADFMQVLCPRCRRKSVLKENIG